MYYLMWKYNNSFVITVNEVTFKIVQKLKKRFKETPLNVRGKLVIIKNHRF